jgi:cysteine-rich repeat protein/predicted outer membrane repeat protein
MVLMGCGDDDVSGGNNQNANSDQAVCGDGITDIGEVCDDGAANSDVEADACRTDCRAFWCGDSVVDTGEACDDGATNSDYLPGACRKNCQEASCGDSTVDQDEACDDGNAEAGDGCDADCQVETFWNCSDRPSQCECEPYHSGANCRACVVFVDVSSPVTTPDGLTWSTAFARIQQGIDAAYAAGPGCEVWVAQGTYLIYDYSPTNSVQLLSDVAVYGGFLGTESQREERDWEANETLLNGQGGPYDRVYHVVEAIDTLDATLDGVTIELGQAFGEDSEDQRGAGVSTKGARITIANCIIRNNSGYKGAGLANDGSVVAVQNTSFLDNRASGRGGAMSNNGGSYQVTDCSFVGNEAHVNGGAIYNGFAELLISGGAFYENRAIDSGGAVFVLSSALTITNTDFVDNYLYNPRRNSVYGNLGGALYVNGGWQILTNCLFQGNDGLFGGGLASSGATSTITGCTFTGNEALEYMDGANLFGGLGGALYTSDASTVMESCLVSDNVAEKNGGGIYSHQSMSTLVGCTVANNATALYGGGISNTFNGTTEITNCILWGNTAGSDNPAINTFPLAPASDAAQSLLLHNDIEGGIPTGCDDLGGNISADASFVDGPNGDYHLRPDSVCIDAGWGDATVPTLDLDGNPRVDLGQSTANGGGGTPNYVDMGAYERQ